MYANNFIDKCLKGEATLSNIDDYVVEWHKGYTKVTLQEYLGMTKEEYKAWLLDDTILNYIILARGE